MLILVLLVCGLNLITASKSVVELPACKIQDKYQQCALNDIATTHEYERVIAIGDIHGSYEGLLTDLFMSNITQSIDSCEWKVQPDSTLLVQMGDIVDRGAGAYDAWKCLRKLQSEASLHDSKVVRLLGNHELWWLEGHLHMINKKADTMPIIQTMVNNMLTDIINGDVLGAYAHKIHDESVLFIHAGIGPKFYQHLQKQLGAEFSVDSIVKYTNDMLKSKADDCDEYPCSFDGVMFEAGPERGGRGIGGPYWTDFSVLEKGAISDPQYDFIQIVGHTMAHCYTHPNKHPTKTHAECAYGLIRPTVELQAICVDGGMYAGARAFLEIDQRGHFVAYQMEEEIIGESMFSAGTKQLKWVTRDLTNEICNV